MYATPECVIDFVDKEFSNDRNVYSQKALIMISSIYPMNFLIQLLSYTVSVNSSLFSK